MIEPTDAEILAQIPAARARAREADAAEPRADSARYDRTSGRVELTSGCALHFPPFLVQGLSGATAAELDAVEVYPGGIGLRWDALDVDLSVPGLIEATFGGVARESRYREGKT